MSIDRVTPDVQGSSEESSTNKYIITAAKIAELVTTKQKQYGNSIDDTSEFLKLLFPQGIEPSQYGDIGILVRMFDKMKRIANGDQGNESAWHDLMGYALLKASDKQMR